MGPVRVSRSVEIPEHELRWRFSRSSGPGGQAVNTADSKVELRFDVASSSALSAAQRSRALSRLRRRLVDGTVVSIVASEHRSQLRNREAAAERLAALLRDALAPPPPRRRPTTATRGATERRLAEKRRRGDVKRLRRAGRDDD